ncbi:hypothetical protein Prudu_011761 [Prunus dulcis]|uniref:Uncharacterized protein n=1 Tax=Prunus dulcis TaxID=3755 RepID=A0A4Y1RBJ2_PRUDU|nr:hypothetical protein Prudu_011761 [Prunus dulcis]
MQDLNFPPSSSSKIPLSLFDDTSTSLELKLVPSSPPSCNYQSLCTLDKVKSALERAEKEPIKRRSSSMWKSSLSSSPSCSSSSSSIKETQEEESEEKLFASPFAAGCPEVVQILTSLLCCRPSELDATLNLKSSFSPTMASLLNLMQNIIIQK